MFYYVSAIVIIHMIFISMPPGLTQLVGIHLGKVVEVDVSPNFLLVNTMPKVEM